METWGQLGVEPLEPACYVQNLVSPGTGFPAWESQVFHWFWRASQWQRLSCATWPLPLILVRGLG